VKEEIVATALKQFLEQGIRSITMQKLAAGMGVSTKTLYKHFPDKEMLLEACLQVHYGGMEKQISSLEAGGCDPVQFICSVYSAATSLDFGANYLFYHDLNHYYPELQDKVIGRFFGGLGTMMLQKMRDGIAGCYFLPYLKPEITFEALGVLYRSVTRFDTYVKYSLTPEDLVKHTISIYLRGICTPKGLLSIEQLNSAT
jgi:AcrR family transcriptional regulator